MSEVYSKKYNLTYYNAWTITISGDSSDGRAADIVIVRNEPFGARPVRRAVAIPFMFDSFSADNIESSASR